MCKKFRVHVDSDTSQNSGLLRGKGRGNLKEAPEKMGHFVSCSGVIVDAGIAKTEHRVPLRYVEFTVCKLYINQEERKQECFTLFSNQILTYDKYVCTCMCTHVCTNPCLHKHVCVQCPYPTKQKGLGASLAPVNCTGSGMLSRAHICTSD